MFTQIFITFTLSIYVVAKRHDPIVARVSTFLAPQLLVGASPPPPSPDCNATCAPFQNIECVSKHCGCNNAYLQAQGDCLLCMTSTPEDAASVEFFLDEEINQCHHDGLPIQFKLQLPPDAQAIVDDVDRQNTVLRRQQTAFLALQIAGGHVGLVVVFCFSIFSHQVRRDPTFLNFCITWILSSIVYSLLLYRGTEGNTVFSSLGEVPGNECLAQAALTNGAQVMTACSTMALVIQLWIGLRAAIHGDVYSPRQKKWTTTMLLISPYIFFFTFGISSVMVGMTYIELEGNPIQRILPTNFYCSVIELSSFLQAIYGVTLALLLITVVFDVLIIIILYQHWRAFRHIQTKRAVSLSILLRVMAFSLYRVGVAVAYGTILDRPPQLLQVGSGTTLSILFGVPVWVDMLQAAIPLVAFLVLGINNDMILSLMFWRRNRKLLSTIQPTASNSTESSVTGFHMVNGHKDTWNDKAIMEADTRYLQAKV